MPRKKKLLVNTNSGAKSKLTVLSNNETTRELADCVFRCAGNCVNINHRWVFQSPKNGVPLIIKVELENLLYKISSLHNAKKELSAFGGKPKKTADKSDDNMIISKVTDRMPRLRKGTDARTFLGRTAEMKQMLETGRKRTEVFHEFATRNSKQKDIVERFASIKDFVLILGKFSGPTSALRAQKEQKSPQGSASTRQRLSNNDANGKSDNRKYIYHRLGNFPSEGSYSKQSTRILLGGAKASKICISSAITQARTSLLENKHIEKHVDDIIFIRNENVDNV
ncbi:hypothetical protein BX616_001243 [Lobosporangium transversale]|nr:hypothetical protein BX616_001243 [Lobosporangium transversale]